MPPEPIRRLRTHTRCRHLTQARTAEKQRVEKLLEDGHLKLSSVISDIHGVSGRDMLNALVAGQRDPKALAQLARGTMRGKIRRLEEALDCSFFIGEHAAVLAMMLAVIDHYTTQIEALNARIEALIDPWLHPQCQNSAMGLDLAFYALRSYSLIRPPRTGRRLIRCRERSATGWSGRGGRSWRPRWGRRPL